VNFLNPLFLFGLAAAAIPILIHLFTRRRPREVKFPSLEFLSEVHQSEIRRLKLKQWLLLALRTLAIACLALAMSRPALKGGAGGRAGAASSLVALVDVSGSMGAPAADGHPLTTTARRVVDDLVSTLGPGDELLLVPYDRAPHPVSERPLGDAGRLRAAAQALQPSAQTTDHRAALELAARALRESRALNRELFWISDFQRAGLGDAEASGARFTAPDGPWTTSRIYLVPLAPRSHANAALAGATLTPAPGGIELSLAASGHDVVPGDFAVEARELTAATDDGPLQPGERLGSGFVSLPARGDAAALLPLARLPEAGGETLLPDDALALDNRRVFAAGRAGTLHVLLREDGSPSPMRLALEAGGAASGFDVRPVDAAALAAQAGDADVIVIGDVARPGPAELQAVLDFWRGGGAVLLAPGARADAGGWNESLLRELGAGRLGPTERAPAGAAWRLVRRAAGHPVLEGFPARPGEPLTSARFGSVRAFTAGPGARVLLEFDRAHPALIEVPHALVLNAELDLEASDFAVSGAFLPLLHQCVGVLARGTASASLVPGDVWRAPAVTGEWRVVDETGRDVAWAEEGKRSATRLATAPLERPGLYRVLLDGKLRSSFAVNPDPRESDLAPLDEAALRAAFPPGRAVVLRAGEDLARRVREARFGRELWATFLALALALLVAESVIARWGMPALPAPGARRGA
jgi:hypothetical protein